VIVTILSYICMIPSLIYRNFFGRCRYSCCIPYLYARQSPLRGNAFRPIVIPYNIFDDGPSVASTSMMVGLLVRHPHSPDCASSSSCAVLTGGLATGERRAVWLWAGERRAALLQAAGSLAAGERRAAAQALGGPYVGRGGLIKDTLRRENTLI
jgi:hypothetical protein